MTLSDKLLATAQAHSARPALWDSGQSQSYEQLFSTALALAARLDALLPRGAAVGIYCERGATALIGILAAVLSGRPYVPMNPSFPGERLSSIISAARPGAILCSAVTQTSLLQILSMLEMPILFLNGSGQVIAGTECDAPEQADTAYLMFTSGTTGTPKGVRVLKTNVLAYLDGIQPIAALTPEDRATQFFDLTFDLSVHDIFVTLTAGAELNVLPKAQSMAIAEFVTERGITSWFSVPSLAGFCDRLGQLSHGSLSGLRQALFCGEPLAVSLARRFSVAAPAARIWNLYGPTEATIAFTAYEMTQSDALDGLAVVPLGHPIGTQEIMIEGEGPTELLLGGSQVTPGYINAPDQNITKFFTKAGKRFYRSGDLVTWSNTRGALYHGRIDDQVKINGYRVELLEIDAALREAADTPEVAAIPWPVSDIGHADQIVGFVCNPKFSTTEIRKLCRERLPPYMVPRRIIAVDRMPLTASGKTDRRALRQMLEEESAKSSA